MTIYFRNYTEKICVVCQRKIVFVFNVARQCLHRRHSWDLPRVCKPFAKHIQFSSSECRERHFYCLGWPHPNQLQRSSQLLPRNLRESSGFLMATLKPNQTKPNPKPTHNSKCSEKVWWEEGLCYSWIPENSAEREIENRSNISMGRAQIKK